MDKKKIQEIIEAALDSRTCLVLNYEDKGERLVEPYLMGLGNTDDHTLLRAYQAAGFSSTEGEGWKLFNLENVTSIREAKDERIAGKDAGRLNKEFKTRNRPHFTKNDNEITAKKKPVASIKKAAR